MPADLRSALYQSGCTDERLLQLFESEMKSLNTAHPKSDLARMVGKCGPDLGALSQYLQKTFDINKKCAAILSLEFSRKASRDSAKSRQLQLGITMGIWRSMTWGKDPCDHLRLDGKHFSLKKGMKYKGRYIFPGEEDGCQCMSAPVIEGFIDDSIPKESLLSKIKRALGF